ncbi:MAG: hypothetical protein ABEH86_12585 [Haloarcula sp.]
MRWLSTLVVVVLLSTAGCSAFGGTDGDAPTPVPTEESTMVTSDPPPGVTTARLDDGRRVHHSVRAVDLRRRHQLVRAPGQRLR